MCTYVCKYICEYTHIHILPDNVPGTRDIDHENLIIVLLLPSRFSRVRLCATP